MSNARRIFIILNCSLKEECYGIETAILLEMKILIFLFLKKRLRPYVTDNSEIKM